MTLKQKTRLIDDLSIGTIFDKCMKLFLLQLYIVEMKT